MPKLLITFLCAGFSGLTMAQESPLPEPLTLAAALQSSSNPEHFDIQLLDQRIRELDALIGVENADMGISIDFKGRLRQVGVSDAGDPDQDGDSAASLLLSKPLYTFGKAESRIELLRVKLQVLMLEKQQLIDQRRQHIMEKYFDVLNADNEFISENEDLAIGFNRYDRARENMLLGLSAEIDVLRLQSAYELIRQKRYQAENKQRLSRMILAEAMGYPQYLPSLLEVPEVDLEKSLTEDVDVLIDQALKHSSNSRVLGGKRRIAEYQIRQAGAIDAPRLELELELSSYERESSTRDDWRATVYLDVPLYSGVRSSNLALAQTRYQKTLAEISQYRSQLRLQILQLWQSIHQNQLVAQGSEVAQSYRDLYLDRSRAEYELEYRTDLGDAMVQFSRARTARFKALYAYELAYYRLQTLVGAEFINATVDGETQ